MYPAGIVADEVLRIRGISMRALARVAVVVCVLFYGCGNDPGAAVGFVNHTRHSDAELWNLWKTAQHNLAQQIDLNPLQRQLNNATPDIVPGDSRALSVSPRQVVVSSQPDISSSVLRATTGAEHPDPTGLIECPQPCNVQFAPAYSLYAHPASRYAASWEFAGNNFDTLVEYEFENQILNALGYDTTWR